MTCTLGRIGLCALLGAALTLSAAAATPARAQAPVSKQALQEAKDAFQHGQEAYDRGDYAGAIAQWQHSFELSQKVSLFYNIGLAYERMGKLEEAVSALERFVSSSQPDDAYLDRGRARLAAIRERVAQTGVLIACDQEGATILVDERDFGRTPRPDRIALAPGNHGIIVRKAGFADFRSDVALSAGQELKLEVKLVALTATPPPDAAVEAEQGAPSEPETTSEGTSLLPPILTIGGGVVAVVGIAVGAVALGKAKDAQSEDDADSARTLALVADISMGVGIAAAAVGSYLWFFADRETPPSEQALRVTPLQDGAALTAQVRF